MDKVQETVEQRVKCIVVRVLQLSEYGATRVTPDVTLDWLGADSLDTVEVMLTLEEEFNIDIPTDYDGRLTTIGEIIEYIETC